MCVDTGYWRCESDQKFNMLSTSLFTGPPQVGGWLEENVVLRKGLETLNLHFT